MVWIAVFEDLLSLGFFVVHRRITLRLMILLTVTALLAPTRRARAPTQRSVVVRGCMSYEERGEGLG